MMSAQAAKAETFRSLHVSGRPLVLFNIWDAGSAKVVASQGARALATGSWSVAAANGFADGERVPLDLAIDNLARIVKANDLPVTVDLESGYGETAGEVAQSVARAIEAGAVGCNLEDSFPRDGSLREIGEQAEELPEPVEPPVIRVLPRHRRFR
jgi:2-methylisocitrate lyase-like PEP mutase family enzyme